MKLMLWLRVKKDKPKLISNITGIYNQALKINNPIMKNKKGLFGAADPRSRDGKAAGF